MNQLDQFAMAALQSLLVLDGRNSAYDSGDIDSRAKQCYLIAEAMQAESDRRGKSELQNKLEENK